MFKKDFVWGAATASYQIEGAVFEDGRSPCVWDEFCKKPGAVFEGHTGEIACDHYHRYKEDVAIMKALGLKAYRFSLSWPRIIPGGTGEVNPKGIAFYSDLIDELIDNGIVPYATLYHWDMPMALYNRGGWMNPESSSWFAEYSRVIAENFSDRVKHFITINEPQCFIGIGFTEGRHAPGLRMPLSSTVPMSHNVLLAHGKSVLALREYGAGDIQIGYAPVFSFPYPETETPENIEAARTVAFETPSDPERWYWSAAWWSDPAILGEYPKDGLELYGRYLPESWERGLETIRQPLDFYGQNIYNGYAVKAGEDGKPVIVKQYEGFPKTACQWPITPETLKWGAKFLYERYKLPIYITENGLSCHDVISLDGKVHDPNRIDFLNRYLLCLREAASEGVDIAGYFQWSLLDNFEWAEGYNERFGMVFVDYPTQRRIIKDSGLWYKSVIESNGDNL